MRTILIRELRLTTLPLSPGNAEPAACIEAAVAKVLKSGVITGDLASAMPGATVVGTAAMGDAVARAVEEA